MLPYLAQGGALALEDALVLADACRPVRDVAGALALPALRLARASRVQAASLRQGSIYRLCAPLAWARNGVFGVVPGSALMARLDWLYGWRLLRRAENPCEREGVARPAFAVNCSVPPSIASRPCPSTRRKS